MQPNMRSGIRRSSGTNHRVELFLSAHDARDAEQAPLKIVMVDERSFQENVASPEEHVVTTPEQVLVRRGLQALDDQAKADAAAEVLKQEDEWVANFIANLNGFIRKIG
jgi:hypothetical protein